MVAILVAVQFFKLRSISDRSTNAKINKPTLLSRGMVRPKNAHKRLRQMRDQPAEGSVWLPGEVVDGRETNGPVATLLNLGQVGLKIRGLSSRGELVNFAIDTSSQ